MAITFYSQETKQTLKVSNLNKVKGVERCVQEYPQKKYAIDVFFDENDNYKPDKNIFGISKEKYGFSNNILPVIRPATFDESAFKLNRQQMAVNIILK